jgi:hypothetical protein
MKKILCVLLSYFVVLLLLFGACSPAKSPINTTTPQETSTTAVDKTITPTSTISPTRTSYLTIDKVITTTTPITTITTTTATTTTTSAPPAVVSNIYSEKAYLHLYEAMDRYHNSFNVYTDKDAGGNHFIPSGWYNGSNNMALDTGCLDSPHSGSTCIRVTWNGASGSDRWKWNGIMFQEPENNWDGGSGGYNLTGATKLTFWARTDEPGLKVKFLMGLPDDTSREVSIDYVPLYREWTKYEIDLSGSNLTNIVGGFGFAFNDVNDPNPDGTIFYLDDIQYDKQRLGGLHFLPSFVTLASEEDQYIQNVAFIYDDALALIALVARGTTEDMQRAKILADSFIFAKENDRYFTDGRMRNAYRTGDLADPAGKALLPGWWDTKESKWFEDNEQISTYTGNIAWVLVAMLDYYQRDPSEKYKNAAEELGKWIYDNCYDERGSLGYTGGYQGWEPNPSKILWKSTEHNIDVYVAFTRLYQLTKDNIWLDRANHAKSFVEAIWDENQKHFWTGTTEDGITINKSALPADVNTWAIIALGTPDKYKAALDWVENNCYVQCPEDGFKGFDFNDDRDGVWFEGTAHTVLAFQATGQSDKANIFLNELQRAQASAQNTDGKGLVAACHDGVSTGFNWKYFNRLHIGATSWYIFAELGYNPYWGTLISEPDESKRN